MKEKEGKKSWKTSKEERESLMTDIKKLKEVVEWLKKKAERVKEVQLEMGFEGLEQTKKLEGRIQGYKDILNLLNGKGLKDSWLDYIVRIYLKGGSALLFKMEADSKEFWG